MAMEMLDRQEKAEALAGLVEQERALFGLDWRFVVKLAMAYSGVEQAMEEVGWPVMIERTGEKEAAIWVCWPLYSQYLGDAEKLLAMVDHELGHIVISPGGPKGQIYDPIEEVQANHIARACAMLRKFPDKILPQPGDDWGIVLEKAYLLCNLDASAPDGTPGSAPWQLRIEPPRDGYGAYARSLFSEDYSGWALMGARVIELHVNPDTVTNEDLLREMWRIVFNPYGGEDTSDVGWERTPTVVERDSTKRQLDLVMNAMRGLGWR